MPRRDVAIAVLTFATLAGCFNFVVDEGTFDGTQWRAVSVVGMAPVVGHEPTLGFGPGSVTGSAGCNGYGSTSLEIRGQSIRIENLAMQAALCADDRVMAVEVAFFGALQAADRIEVRSGRLFLGGPRGELVFEPLPGPDEAVE